MGRLDSLPFELLEEILFKLNHKSLAIMRCVDKSINSHISNDPYFNSNFKGSERSDSSSSSSSPEFTPPLPSAMEVDDEKVDVMEVDDKPNSGLGMIMSMICKISPYVQNWLLVKKKETRVGKRLLVKDETTTLMKIEDVESCSSYNLEERINKRRRMNSYACN